MILNRLAGTVVIGILGLVPVALRADSSTIVNPSFEDTTVPLSNPCAGAGCAFNLGPIPGWTSSVPNGFGEFRPGSNTIYFNPGFPSNGVNIAFSSTNATLSQTLTTNASPNTSYTLQVDVGRRKDYGPGAAFTIQLLVGGVVVAATSDSDLSIPVGGFVTEVVNYLNPGAGPTGPLGIAIVNFGTMGQGDYDNVRLTAVPEPGTLALLGLGLTALAVRRRSKRNQQLS